MTDHVTHVTDHVTCVDGHVTHVTDHVTHVTDHVTCGCWSVVSIVTSTSACLKLRPRET